MTRPRLLPRGPLALASLLSLFVGLGACGDGSDDKDGGPGGDGDRDGSLADGQVAGDGDGDGDGDRDGAVADGAVTDGGDCTGDACAALCGTDAVWTGTKCASCPPCDGEGEIAPWPTASRNGFCICETAPGYFYSVAGRIGAQRCDADGDGWTRVSARSVLEERNDPALTANAHCDLRVVDRFVLRNWEGETKEFPLDPGTTLALYESDRNDDDELLKFRWTNDNLPNYHEDGKPVSAAEINSLTKICHSAATDYNDNGVPDVQEHPDVALAPSFDKAFKPFVQFSYFAELHRGSYKANPLGGPGSYIIQEKSRELTAQSNVRVPVKYGAAENNYWRSCSLQRDSEWSTVLPPVGMDYAILGSSAGWSGMNYHSQFKCFVVSSTPDAENPNQVSKAELAASPVEYRINDCRAQGQPLVGDKAPSLTSFTCDVVDPATTQLGRAYWGAYRYRDYLIPGDPADMSLAPSYVRGCINSCAVADTGCSPITGPSNEQIRGCLYDPADFGKKLGCAEECDGQDNDFDGDIDNGASGQPCTRMVPAGGGATMPLLGDCALGSTLCKDAVLTCEGFSPGDQAEICDGRDNDCDGVADPADTDIPGHASFCDAAVNPADGSLLVGSCRFGKNYCTETPVDSGAHQLLCISDTDIDSLVENACNASDDDCDGKVDETWTYWEGDNETDLRFQCTGTLDTTTNTVVASVNDNCSVDGAASPASGHTEICENAVDDDCDGTVDEDYVVGATEPISLGCKWPCSSPGLTKCSNVNVPERIVDPVVINTAYSTRDVVLDLDAVDPMKGMYFDPPWYNGFNKVLICQNGFWEILEVCGLNETGLAALPRTGSGWGGNYGNKFCASPGGVPQCTSTCSGCAAGCQYQSSDSMIPGCVYCKTTTAPCLPQ